MDKEEIWMPVRGYEDLYEVSNLGRVRSLNYRHTGKTKERKAWKYMNGYLQVQLCKDGKVKHHLVHRLVWEAFCCEIPEWTRGKLQINHLDEDKTNNNIFNLELCTAKRNCNYGTRNVRAAKTQTNRQDKSKPVQQIDRVSGEVINTFQSIMEAKRQTGINNRNIVSCCKGKRNHAGGFIWQYAEECLLKNLS